MPKIRLKAFWIVLGFLTACPSAWGASSRKTLDETMLMFVGEELSVVTVASRIPETPAAAPAIARVVDHWEIEARGFQTLAELLAAEPGFYVAQEARGSVPFLRGIPNGVLFLYDGVPFSTDVTGTKFFSNPIDREISLHNVKRVEIVRGPGSVLWGADAFAGIVNVVPFSGRDRQGFETKAFGGSNDLRGAYVSYGGSGKNWDAFLSGSGSKERYHDSMFNVERPIGSSEEEPLGESRIGDSYYAELTGNAHVGDWLTVSGRLSDFNRRYTLHDIGGLSWAAERESPMSFLKATATKTIGPSHLSLTGYYQTVRFEITDVDLRRGQENDIYYGELLWDRRVMKKGLLTAGASMRINKAHDVIVQEGFAPSFLDPENIGTSFGRGVAQIDFTNRLNSIFAQYRHQFLGIEWWIGARMDEHSEFDTTLTHSLGLNWPISEKWRMKTSYGTAYRSPFAPQLRTGTDFDAEAISTVNFQISWNPVKNTTLDSTFFYSRLSDHFNEDPIGDLSNPSEQKIYGVEFSGRTRLWENFDLFGSLTALDSQGDPNQYSTISFFLRANPDGTFDLVPQVTSRWEEEFDTGPNLIGNLGGIWQFHPKASLTFNARNTSKIPFTFAEDTAAGKFYSPILLDLTLRVQDVLIENTTFTLRGTNLLDQNYQIPGFYGPVEGDGFAVYAEIAYRF